MVRHKVGHRQDGERLVLTRFEAAIQHPAILP
jgi:hypothetical protein